MGTVAVRFYRNTNDVFKGNLLFHIRSLQYVDSTNQGATMRFAMCERPGFTGDLCDARGSIIIQVSNAALAINFSKTLALPEISVMHEIPHPHQQQQQQQQLYLVTHA
ncbi:unnamed protein product [Rotaria magnacalcarata]|uniref:Uncharacterized protein n=1 Tax=Rotaria magnacalcarata TaxID=392030 RepID=A0A815B0H6_9BILA|nr:unnamed protein product [Rotaria magnacalcarata]